MSDLDKELQAAMEALADTTPANYFDELPSRIEARLEVEMAGTAMAKGDEKAESDPTQPPIKAGDLSTAEGRPNRGPTGGGPSREENSGLHDIKELARSQKQKISKRMSTQSDAEEALLASSASGLSAVVLPKPGKDQVKYKDAPAIADQNGRKVATASPADRGGLPVWVYGVVGVAAAAAVAVFFVVRSSGKDGERVAGNETASANSGAPAASADKPSTPDDLAPAGDEASKDEVAPAAEPEPAAATATDKADEADEVKSDDDAAESKKAVSTKRVARVAPRPPARGRRSARNDKKRAAAKTEKPKKAAPKKGDTKAAPKKGNDDGTKSIDDLLSQAAGIKKKKPADTEAEPEPKKPTKKKLSRGEIRSGMRAVLGRVSACYNTHRVSGTVMVRITIAPSGSVSAASATGKFAGTPTGRCVAAAVKRARFPAYDGKPTTFPYPFLLSP